MDKEDNKYQQKYIVEEDEVSYEICNLLCNYDKSRNFENLSFETTLNELGLELIDITEISMELEKIYNIVIQYDELKSWEKFIDILKTVMSKTNNE